MQIVPRKGRTCNSLKNGPGNAFLSMPKILKNFQGGVDRDNALRKIED